LGFIGGDAKFIGSDAGEFEVRGGKPIIDA
jgi:hypothetical protein